VSTYTVNTPSSAPRYQTRAHRRPASAYRTVPAPQSRQFQVSNPVGFISSPAGGIIIIAGGITFANEWYQTKQINWRIPVATIILAAIFDGLAHLDSKVATGLSVMALIGALTAEFGGKSAASTLAGLFPASAAKAAAPKPAAPTSHESR
jgi:hypothetical protein